MMRKTKKPNTAKRKSKIMQETVIPRKNPNMVTRLIDEETILLPIYKTSNEINCIYTLNKVASHVWNMIDGKRTIGDIRKQILDEFDTTPEEAENEMRKLLKDLKEINAII